MEKFRGWLNENNIDTTVVLNEATKNKKTNKLKILAVHPEYEKELEKLFAAPLMSDKEASVNQDKFKGLFYRNTTSTTNGDVAYVRNSPAAAAIAKAANNPDSGVSIDAKGIAMVTMSDGTTLSVDVSGGGSTRATANGAAREFFKDNKPFQEATFAALIQRGIQGIEVPAVKNPKAPKYKVASWILASDPIAKTGIFEYVNAGISADQKDAYMLELENYLIEQNQGQWAKTFEKVGNERWQNKIASVFTTAGAKNLKWKNARILRDNTPDPDVSEELLYSYFNGGRCGYPSKDIIDKADILLTFDPKNTNKYLKKILSFKDKSQIREHNNYINDLLVNGKMIGVSLKQLGSGDIRISVLNVTTTAVGEQINPDNQTVVRFIGDDDPDNTFDASNTYLKTESDTVSTYAVKIPVNHNKHIHTPEGAEMKLSVKNQDKRVAAVYQSDREKAQMGSANAILKQSTDTFGGYDIPAYVAKYQAKMDRTKAIRKVAEDVVNIFKNNQLVCHRVFAQAVAYPLVTIDETGEHVESEQAPYIKIY